MTGVATWQADSVYSLSSQSILNKSLRISLLTSAALHCHIYGLLQRPGMTLYVSKVMKRSDTAFTALRIWAVLGMVQLFIVLCLCWSFDFWLACQVQHCKYLYYQNLFIWSLPDESIGLINISHACQTTFSYLSYLKSADSKIIRSIALQMKGWGPTAFTFTKCLPGKF